MLGTPWRCDDEDEDYGHAWKIMLGLQALAALGTAVTALSEAYVAFRKARCIDAAIAGALEEVLADDDGDDEPE